MHLFFPRLIENLSNSALPPRDQRDKTMADKLMYIPNEDTRTPSVD